MLNIYMVNGRSRGVDVQDLKMAHVVAAIITFEQTTDYGGKQFARVQKALLVPTEGYKGDATVNGHCYADSKN